MKLPYLPNVAGRNMRQVVEFRGINWSEQTRDGDLRDSLNLSTRKYPFLSTRRARKKMAAYSGATAMTSRGSLVVVQGTDLIYDGEVVGQVMAGEKQFAVVNTKLVIWPDKVYLDLNSKTLGTLGARVEWPECVFYDTGEVNLATYDHADGTGEHVPPDLTKYFKEGDAIKITGCSVEKNNQELVVKSVEKDSLHFGENLFEDTPTSPLENIVLERRVPDLDFICESENRLWGCCSETQTIYASALGDPTNFYIFEGTNADSYTLAVGSAGEFTGCCRLSSSVLFWKEEVLHKLLGGYPAEYAMYTYEMEGLQRGCHKSLQVINEVLYYQGLHGVYAYTGGLPTLVSDCFGDRRFENGVAGSDGDTYFLSVLEGTNTHRLLVYETKMGFWMQEDDTDVVDFARVGKDLFLLDGAGDIWQEDCLEEDPEIEWLAQFAPFYDAPDGRRLYSRIILRVELPTGSWLRVESRSDNGVWKESGKILGRDMDSVPVVLPINRCDRFEVRLSGKGPCAVKAMVLEYAVGSDV